METLTYTDNLNDDIPTAFNHSLFNVAISFLSFLLLGMNFNNINNGYFTSVLMYCLPMLIKCASYTSKIKAKKIIRIYSLSVLIITTVICILGLIGILIILTLEDSIHIIVQEGFVVLAGFSFPAKSLWILSGICFFTILIDHFIPKPRLESALSKVSTTSARSGK